MKKPLLQRKIVWLLIICLIWFASCEIKGNQRDKEREVQQEQLEKEADKVLKGMVEVPDATFKTKEEVTELLKAANLKPKFVVANLDDKAKESNHFLKKDECYIDDQPEIKYFDSDEVGSKYGDYAKKGSTIIVGYSDHDFDGTKKKKNTSNDSKEKNSASQNSSSNEATEISEINEDWYSSDSRYATMEPVKKTVEAQMEELGIDDPVRAIIVNDIQTYLFDVDGTETSVTDINQKLEYSRMGFYIDIKYNGSEPAKEMIKIISDDLLNVSGHKYTVE